MEDSYDELHSLTAWLKMAKTEDPYKENTTLNGKIADIIR